MELNWSTFFLEIINFLVLVWILKRFLYRPVLAILETRREKIEQKLTEATKLHTEAIDLQRQYQGRLDEWALEKQHALELLQQDIQTEKIKQLEQLQTELGNEREKSDAVQQRHQTDTLKQLQQLAHAQGARFASRLLNAVANAELESQLFNLLIKSFDQLDENYLTTLRNACKQSIDNIMVTSAYPLSDIQHQQLEKTLSTLCNLPINITYLQDADLIAGLRIAISDWVVRFNLQDELSGFAELSHENPIS